ncbi:MAG: hypothetical protein LC749_10685, partial [Actinobacteria bacterium]|nr:hypothetical protein [Actinomycetota bacterium]
MSSDEQSALWLWATARVDRANGRHGDVLGVRPRQGGKVHQPPRYAVSESTFWPVGCPVAQPAAAASTSSSGVYGTSGAR